MGINPVTIKDLVKILEVAPSTVFRTLKNHPNISEITKKQNRVILQDLFII